MSTQNEHEQPVVIASKWRPLLTFSIQADLQKMAGEVDGSDPEVRERALRFLSRSRNDEASGTAQADTTDTRSHEDILVISDAETRLVVRFHNDEPAFFPLRDALRMYFSTVKDEQSQPCSGPLGNTASADNPSSSDTGKITEKFAHMSLSWTPAERKSYRKAASIINEEIRHTLGCTDNSRWLWKEDIRTRWSETAKEEQRAALWAAANLERIKRQLRRLGNLESVYLEPAVEVEVVREAVQDCLVTICQLYSTTAIGLDQSGEQKLLSHPGTAARKQLQAKWDEFGEEPSITQQNNAAAVANRHQQYQKGLLQ